jgi:hypothetical protein
VQVDAIPYVNKVSLEERASGPTAEAARGGGTHGATSGRDWQCTFDIILAAAFGWQLEDKGDDDDCLHHEDDVTKVRGQRFPHRPGHRRREATSEPSCFRFPDVMFPSALPFAGEAFGLATLRLRPALSCHLA